MDVGSQAVAGVLEAIGAAHNRFRVIADELTTKLTGIQVAKPDWSFWFEPRDPASYLGVGITAHLDLGSLSWALIVFWQSDADVQSGTNWRVLAEQSWSSWYPWDGWPTLRESERQAADASGLRDAIRAAVQDVDQWLAATDFDVLTDPAGLDPNNGRYGEALDGVCRRLGI